MLMNNYNVSQEESSQDLEQGRSLHQRKQQFKDIQVTEKVDQEWIRKSIRMIFKTPFSPHSGRYSGGLISEGAGDRDRYVSGESPKIYDQLKRDSRPADIPSGALNADDFHAPERHLVLVAVRLAILEKAASGLGMIAFIWATVVLLGGFVSTLSSYDFRLISALLLTEGTRIFSRSQEIEWQHAGSRTYTLLTSLKRASSIFYEKGSDVLLKSVDAVRSTFANWFYKLPASTSHNAKFDSAEQQVQHVAKSQKTQNNKASHRNPVFAKRSRSRASLPLIPYASLFDARTISRILYLLQLASASVNIGFSISRLISQKYGGDTTDKATRNRNFAINIFYGLALSEATIFLIERAYWEFKIRWRKLLKQVNEKCHFGDEHLEMMTQFFYDVYSNCLNGSVFHGLDMDLVQHAITKIQSSIGVEQLGGVRMLCAFVTKDISAEHTLRRIGTTLGAVDRLMEMLTWKSKHERQVRTAAAFIITRLVRNQNNCYRVVSMPGGLDAIVSLLIEEEEESRGTGNVSFWAPKDLKLFGLKILKNLANVRSNHVQLGNARGLLHILISSIEVKSMAELKNTDEVIEMKVFKKSLQLLRQLATRTGYSGEYLRAEISKSVYVLRHLRDILEYGSSHLLLQEYSVDILTSLALDGNMREKIGSTGGIIRNLLALFFKDKLVEEKGHDFIVCLKAGEALHLLVVQSPKNCLRMIYLDDVCSREGSSKTLRDFISSLGGHPKASTCAANTLRSLCVYLDETAKHEIAGSVPNVSRMAVNSQGKQQEAFLGLAACTIPLLQSSEFNILFTEDFDKHTFVKKFMSFVPDLSSCPRLPRIRRHSVELANALMLQDTFFLQAFTREGLTKYLAIMLDTMSDVENYYTYSGAVGLTLHSQTMEELIHKSMRLLHKK
ncbi:hypothetical protein O6H91_14G030300 [Diphasiastrum complanatum]|uniref:Uncharacterized protein n=3 Tax=Diphasiastrum complanatum TaxID=34168 RepID=A0ACC2BMT6_DIPCM|nr:hypothetical protein O6H91_14G030300 [Diphasiastrum complanatum]